LHFLELIYIRFPVRCPDRVTLYSKCDLTRCLYIKRNAAGPMSRKFLLVDVNHHSFSLSLQAQNLPYQQIRPTVHFFYLLDCLTITGLDCTYNAHHFVFSFTF